MYLNSICPFVSIKELKINLKKELKIILIEVKKNLLQLFYEFQTLYLYM